MDLQYRGPAACVGCIFHYDEKKPEKVERDPSLVAKEPSKTFSPSAQRFCYEHSRGEEDRPNFSGSYYSETKAGVIVGP